MPLQKRPHIQNKDQKAVELIAEVARYRKLLELIPDGMLIIDPHHPGVSWPIIECNDAFCQMNGYKRSELLGQSIDILHGGAEDPDVRRAYLERLRQEGTIAIETVHHRKDGTQIFIQTTTSLIELGGQELVVGIDRDITAQKDAEEKMRQWAAELEALRQASLVLTESLTLPTVLDAILTSVMALFPEVRNAHIFLYQDGALEFGAAIDEAGPMEQPFAPPRSEGLTATVARQGELIIVEDMQSHPLYASSSWSGAIVGLPLKVRERVAGVMTMSLKQPRPLVEAELRVLELLADQAALAIQNARLYLDLERHNDDLEQMVAEKTAEVRQSLGHLQSIVQNSPNAILLLSPDGLIRDANPAFAALFGLPPESVRDHPPTAFVDEAHRPAFDLALESVKTERRAVQVEVTVHREGNTRDIAVALAPVEENDRMLGMVCNMWDITAFKEVERLKDHILAVTAHELRTPLTSVLGFSEILLTRQLDEAAQDRYLKLINKQSVQLKHIIDDLLDVSLIQENAGLPIERSSVAVEALIQKVVAPFVESSLEHDIQVKGIPDITVEANPIRLEQLFRNLLANAVKYSPEGGLIEITGQAADGWLYVEVKDEGIGISPEQQVHVFERFYRAEDTPSAPGGVGLGLTICRMIAEEHGGQIDVESVLGKGSTFRVILPLGS